MTSLEQKPINPSLSFLEGIKQVPFEADLLDEVGDGSWTINDSSIHAYGIGVYFPKYGRNPIEAIVDRIGRKDTNVAMDLAGGSNGAALQGLMEMGVIGTGLVTNYEDRRCPATREIESLDHVEGDLTKRCTWERIIEWADLHTDGGFDLIMHRPVGGLQYLPPKIYSGAVQALIELLKPGGLIFCQIPYKLTDIHDNPEIKAIGDELKRNSKVEKIARSKSPDGYDQHALIYRACQ